MKPFHNLIYSSEPEMLHPRRLFRKMWEDLRDSRELALRLTIRNLSALYRRTMFGYLWAFLPPLLAAATFLILRKGGVTSAKEIAIPYAPWILCGAFIWQTFADSVTAPLRLVVQSKSMLTKISFPREALLLAAVGEVLFNLAI